MILAFTGFFCQFQSGVAYKKSVPSIFENLENTSNHLLINYSSHNYYLQTFLSVMYVHGTTLSLPQTYQCKPSNESQKEFYLFLKPKWYLDTKFVAFQLMVTVDNRCFLILKPLC